MICQKEFWFCTNKPFYQITLQYAFFYSGHLAALCVCKLAEAFHTCVPKTTEIRNML